MDQSDGMQNVNEIFLVPGSLLLLGLATDYLGRISSLPRVTLLIVFGVLFGAEGLSIIPVDTYQWFPLITDTALLLVGFLLGGKLSYREFVENSRDVFRLS